MDDQTRRGIEADCTKLMIRSVHLLDRRRYQPLAELFGGEGEWLRGGKAYRGFDAIMGSLNERAPDMLIRHILTTIDVSVHGPDFAEALGYFLVYKASGDGETEPSLPAALMPPSMVAEMKDQYRMVGGAWRIAKRETARIFQQA